MPFYCIQIRCLRSIPRSPSPSNLPLQQPLTHWLGKVTHQLEYNTIQIPGLLCMEGLASSEVYKDTATKQLCSICVLTLF